MAAQFAIQMRDQVAPKVNGGLAAIEEEIREEDETRLSVTPVAADVVSIDGFPIPVAIHSRWRVGKTLVAEVRGQIVNELEADCTIFVDGAQVFEGTIDEWWMRMCKLLRAEVRRAGNYVSAGRFPKSDLCQGTSVLA